MRTASSTRGIAFLALLLLLVLVVACSSLLPLAEARPHDGSTPEERRAARHAARSNEVDEAPVEGSPAKKDAAAAPAPSLKDLAGGGGSNSSSSSGGSGGGGGGGKVSAKSSFSSSSSSSSTKAAKMKCAPDSGNNNDKLANSPLGYAASQLANAPCARAASGRSRRPSLTISSRPTSPVGPKRCFRARTTRSVP